MTETIPVRVKAVTWENEGIRLYDLRPVDGRALPPFTAGAHIDLHLPIGLVRSYSLVNAPAERHRYVLGVSRDHASRGGSRWLHDHLGPGDILEVDGPRNNFPLEEAAPYSLLVAGGIGITPMMSMIRRLGEVGRSWELHYFARSRATAAFLEELSAHPGRVHLGFDDEAPGRLPDIAGLVAAAPAGAHLYCCGPTGMLAAFERATAGLPRERVHVEYFSAREDAAMEGNFLVELARSRRVVAVPAGQTILEALQANGVEVPHSCLQGVCGTCETRVLAGVPDHRDAVLSEDERAAGETMMICCSGAKSEKLVLDL